MTSKETLIYFKVFLNKQETLSINPAHKRLIEKNQLIDLILDSTSFLLDTPSLYERLYCIKHDIKQLPLCNVCKTPIKFSEGKKRYSNFCRTCSQKNPTVRQRYYDSMIKRYGVKSPIQNIQIREQIKNTNLKKYGSEFFTQTDDFQNAVIRNGIHINSQQIEHALEFLTNPKWLKEQNNSKSLVEISKNLEVSPSVVQKYYAKFNIEVKQHYLSQPEREINDFILSLDIQTETRVKRYGPEIDIFIPDLRIGFEINGVYWHSELNGKTKNYHINKTIKLQKHGIRLIHIFDVEWIQHQDIIKSRILSFLNKISNRIYARNCELVNVDHKTKKLFFEQNHIQGDAPSSDCFGLKYDNKIVSMMSFSKARYSDAEYEIIRFATILNTSVSGGASKLFKHFVNVKNPSSVVSYSNKRFNTGKVYTQIGLCYSHSSSPNYFYFHKSNVFQLLSRFQFQKHKLSSKLNLFDSKLSEWGNMTANGYDRIWDCGNDVFIWKKD